MNELVGGEKLLTGGEIVMGIATSAKLVSNFPSFHANDMDKVFLGLYSGYTTVTIEQ
jgi:hypothetical protein